nr:GNAT family protein [Pandoraea pulmonicola]
MNEAVAESAAELGAWLPWARPTPTLLESERACRAAYARYLLNEDLMVLFFLRDSGALIGGGGLHRIDWELRHFEIGYWGRTKYSGQGLITEAVAALASLALKDLAASRVYLTVDTRNTKSCRVAELAGFELEGVLRNERFDVFGRFRDTKVFSRLV